ncbi:MAG: GNAT family N-acetyltransferase [Thermoleophilaceae bacterium]
MPAALIPERVETERLVLRRNTAADLAAFVAIWRDPAVWESLMGGGEPNREFAAERHAHQVEHWERHGFGLYLVEIGGEVAGWCGPWHPAFIPSLSSEIEIGWTLGQPFWGAGYATEAATTAAGIAFEHLSPPRTISLIAPSNERSRGVAERLAMGRVDEVEIPDSGVLLDVWELRPPSPDMP